MTAEKAILRIIPSIQAAELVRNIKQKKPVKSAVDTIFGTAFIKAESDLIKSL